MSTKHNGGLPATNNYGESPFGIYRNALDFVMSSLSLDEDAATEVILNELGCTANGWLETGVQSVTEEIKESRLAQRAVDWGQAWLN